MKREPFTTERPWGNFEQFTTGEPVTVKMHIINPNSAWSLQYHEKRDEFYKILSGHPKVEIEGEVKTAKPGDEFQVPRLAKHRIETGVEGAQLLEICYGEFDENDIKRLEDKYGRT